MRQGDALGTRPHWPSQTVSRKNRICARYAPATLLARHLDPTGTRPVSCWNQSGARVCVRGVRWASHALSVAKVPLDKNRYALSMRWPHSSLGNWIHAEHGLDSAKTLVSLRYLCAGGVRPIYIYIYIRRVNLFGSYAPAYAPYIYIYAKSSIAKGPNTYF